jgi:hypothetical protein
MTNSSPAGSVASIPPASTLDETKRTASRIIAWFRTQLGMRSCTLALFLLILLVGIFSRVWQFNQVPPGLNQDEASIGVEAYDLLHFGVDRNGISFPVNFISWGYGMDALYGYLLIPFVLFGLTSFLIRLPSLITGILTLPLVYFIAKRTLGPGFGLLAMFLLAISPWHIILSRWGLNENIVPFIFCLGVACLLLSSRTNSWFVAAAAIFGLSLYAYAALYVAVPIFMLITIPLLLRAKRLGKRSLLIGTAVFLALAIPLLLFVMVNSLGWNPIRLWIFTIPRLPVKARFLSMAAVSHSAPLATMIGNLRGMVKLLLVNQTDGMIWNDIVPFGYMYSFSIVLAIVGAVLLIPRNRLEGELERLLLLAWLAAAFCIGLVQSVSVNRLGLIFLPLILCTAACLDWLGHQSWLALAAVIGIYLISFFMFTNVYHSSEYRESADSWFFTGLIPALQQASQEGRQPICITDSVNMPYIYVLFVEKMNPTKFLQEVQYLDPDLQSGIVRSLGRYTFGVKNCPVDPATVYVLEGEKPPVNGVMYVVKNYNRFQVYSPVLPQQ